MTTITTQATDRKEMVRKLAAYLEVSAVYQGIPSYAYQIGDLTVNRNSSITGEREALIPVVQFLHANGYITTDYTVLDADEEQPETPTHTCIGFPLAEFTPQTLTNMLRMLYARQFLIREMTRSDRLSIDDELVTRLKDEQPETVEAIGHIVQDCVAVGMVKGMAISEGTLGIEFPCDPENPAAWNTSAKLLCAMADKAKQAHHASAELMHPEDCEMKYFARCWLMQLGFGGADFKVLRSALLDHLHGYAAFRTADKMQAHQEKYSTLRRQHREETQQPDLEAPAQEAAAVEKEEAQ
ncbi:MAG: hypothetical protein PHI27_10020 [Eubacteriales bacterium]|nr:hypothetical protein [Eubacteriales bacterium]MDD4513411.1 hypothetical protein [Eubacteriales bacterium]